MNEKKTPRIRFKDFTDDWEQRKVSDLAEKTYGGGTPTTSNEAYWNGDISWIQSSDVVDGKLLGVEPRKWITQDGLNNSAAQLIPGNSIAIITRVGVGKLAFMPYSYATSQDFLSLSKLNAEPLFTVYALYKKLQSELNAVQGTSIKGITKDELLAKSIMIPQYAEQQQIGAFFKQLDHLITLHQRKYEKLQIIKKSMLENCFPKNGEKVPKIRFSGFTGDWEQRKLGELYTERNERGNRSLQILSVSIHTGVSDGELDVDNLGKFIRRSEDKSTYKHVHSGDLIFNMMRAWQGAIGVAKTEGMISPAYISAIPSEDIYPPFMNYLLRRKNVINQINNLSYGVTDFRKRLYWNSFVQVNCKLPSVEEQRNLTDVFEKIDNLITLHQSELEKLQKIKKSLLERMFV